MEAKADSTDTLETQYVRNEMDISEDSMSISLKQTCQPFRETWSNKPSHSATEDVEKQKTRSRHNLISNISQRISSARSSSPRTDLFADPGSVQNDQSELEPVEEVDIAPTMTANKHQVIRTSGSERYPQKDINEASEVASETPVVVDGFKKSAIESPNHFPTSDPEGEEADNSKGKFVLRRDNRERMVQNFGEMYFGDAFNVMFGNEYPDAQHRPAKLQQNVGNIHVGTGANVTLGEVHHYHSPALFGVLQALRSDATDDTGMRYRQSRASQQVSMQHIHNPYA